MDVMHDLVLYVLVKAYEMSSANGERLSSNTDRFQRGFHDVSVAHGGVFAELLFSPAPNIHSCQLEGIISCAFTSGLVTREMRSPDSYCFKITEEDGRGIIEKYSGVAKPIVGQHPGLVEDLAEALQLEEE